MNNILLILLGCNILSILNNRLDTSFKFIDEHFSANTDTKFTWFLSGGIKNQFDGAESEASIMKYQIDNIINLKYNNKYLWDFVLDKKSTNTAENFFWASKFLNSTSKSFDSIFVVTSSFHFKRAQSMLNMIDSSKNFNWILGDLEEKDSRYMETIHIKNVYSDVSKAKSKLEKII
jgi:hypothetical protein